MIDFVYFDFGDLDPGKSEHHRHSIPDSIFHVAKLGVLVKGEKRSKCQCVLRGHSPCCADDKADDRVETVPADRIRSQYHPRGEHSCECGGKPGALFFEVLDHVFASDCLWELVGDDIEYEVAECSCKKSGKCQCFDFGVKRHKCEEDCRHKGGGCQRVDIEVGEEDEDGGNENEATEICHDDFVFICCIIKGHGKLVDVNRDFARHVAE